MFAGFVFPSAVASPRVAPWASTSGSPKECQVTKTPMLLEAFREITAFQRFLQGIANSYLVK